MRRILTSAACVAALTTLVGCATSKEELLPHAGATMLDVWNQHSAGPAGANQSARRLLDARQSLRRPLKDPPAPGGNAAYTRTAHDEIRQQFRRLPNPDLLMYVFPHLAGSESVPVPGYSTVFPFYERVHYAMPGERTEDY